MSTVKIERRDAVLEIVLDRPAALNALDRALLADLGAAVSEAASDRSARVVLLRGSGSHFMAGGDIRMFGEIVAGDPASRRADLHRLVDDLHPIVTGIRTMPKPVLAVVQGAAAGFGLSLVLAADLAIAAENAIFSVAYINLGTSPDGGSTYLLPRIVGLKRAAELMMLGERFDAKRALDLGIVNRVVVPDQLDNAAQSLAQRLANGPTQAYAQTKALLQASVGRELEAQLGREADAFAACAATPDFVEGVTAFLDKRSSRFNGQE